MNAVPSHAKSAGTILIGTREKEMQEGKVSPLLWLCSAAAVAVAVLIYVYGDRLRLNRRRRRLPLPPGPQGWPIVGSLLDLGSRPHEALGRMAAKYGPLMSVRLGTQLAVVASSPAMAQQILKKHDHVLSGRFEPDSAHGNKLSHAMILTKQPGPSLRNARRLASTHLFTAAKLESLRPLRGQQLERTLRHIADAAAADAEVEIRRAVFGCTVNLMATTFFGTAIFNRGAPDLNEFHDAVMDVLCMLGTPNVSDFFPLLRALDLQGVRRQSKRAYDKLYAKLDTLLQERLAEPPEKATLREDLLAVLLDSRSSEFGLDDVVGFIVAMFLAGTETVTLTVEWIMTELMRNPDMMAKCYAEMDVAVGRERLVTEGDVERLPYLNAVIKETYRMRPGGPLLVAHRALEDVEVAGYLVPKGSRVFVNVWAIGHDPATWDSPETFDPERFLRNPEVDFRGQHFELLPFGSGRRMCVGMPLGIRMVFSLVASLLQAFDWSLPAGMSPADVDMDGRVGLAVTKVVPLRIRPSLRLPSHLYQV